MKEGWEVKKLGEVCVRKQDVVRANVCFDEKDVINYIDISSIDNIRHLVAETKEFCFVDAPSRAQQVVKEDDIIVSLVRPNLKNIAKLVGIPKNSIASTGFCVLRTRDCVISNYIKYSVLSEHFTNYLISRTSGINYPAVKEDDIKNYSLFVPPISEQSRIVEELDLLSNIIEKKRQQLSELDNLAQSIFYDMFGEINEFVPLSDYIGALKAGKSLAGDEECVNKVLKTGAVTYDYFDEKQVKNLPQDYTPITEHKVNSHDLLISRMNTAELVGACAYVWNIDSSTYLPDRLWKAEIKNNANAIYLWKAIVSEKSKEQIRQYASGTSGSMKNISKSSFLKVQIPLVSLSLQQLFAQKIEAIEKQKELIKQSIAETEELFNSRMDYYFS